MGLSRHRACFSDRRTRDWKELVRIGETTPASSSWSHPFSTMRGEVEPGTDQGSTSQFGTFSVDFTWILFDTHFSF